jgi:ubiquinone/menaquinone biosynthesis C-methylase UbiE
MSKEEAVEPSADDAISLSDQMKRQCNQRDIHDSWEKTYRTEGVERTWEAVFDCVTAYLKQPADSHALDIGCGKCYNSLRLARRGYQVTAGDYSEAIISEARKNVEKLGLADRISISRQDILSLTYPENSFDLVLCYGVLMHIPEIERAIAELARVCKPGGFIVLEEISMWAPEALLMRTYWRLLKQGRIKITAVPQGRENSTTFAGETLFWRHTDFAWLQQRFAAHGCLLQRRGSSMFTELYQYMPGQILKNLCHRFNRNYPRSINISSLAYHNLLFLQKQAVTPGLDPRREQESGV